MWKRFYRSLALGLCAFVLVSCQEVSLKAPGAVEGQGEVQDFSIEQNVRVALYSSQEVDKGLRPKLDWGSMDVRLITIDGVTYMVDWEDLKDFKNLKKGEKLHFRATDYIARIEHEGKNYRVVRLNEL